jgi:SAM-dependent methyltransferase
MADEPIRFDDGAAYEQLMGRWSRLAGEPFLDWIALPPAARCIDVGCGNGAFTELLLDRCQPAEVMAFDPSPGQLAYARQRLRAEAPVQWAEGDAMRLPVAEAQADAALMALVLFFVPDPGAGVAEMCRVVRPGGLVAAYHWDLLGGGFPLAAIGAEMLKIGLQPRLPPSVAASTLEASTALWEAAGLQQVQTCQISVQRRFDSFDDYWSSAAASNTLKSAFESLSPAQLAELQARVRLRLPADDDGGLTVGARANAVRGVKG